MIGYRGALRYTHEPDLLELELQAVERVWEAGHANVHLMLPVRADAARSRPSAASGSSGSASSPGRGSSSG